MTHSWLARDRCVSDLEGIKASGGCSGKLSINAVSYRVIFPFRELIPSSAWQASLAL